MAQVKKGSRMNPLKGGEIITMSFTAIQLMAIHGNVCLGLRHPQNRGISRAIVKSFILDAEKKLVECGLLNEDDIRKIHRVENEEIGISE